jgi:adenylate cyclase
MAHLTIRLLGPVQIALDGEPVTGFESEKARALLAYLAAEPDRPHRREVLAEMLWPGRPEGAARANLRHTLAHLRQVIGDRAASPPFLLPDRAAIRFNTSSDAWIDVAVLSALLSTQPPATLPADRQTVQQFEDAVRLYRGPFLEDLSLPDSAAFEEWRVLRREQFNRLVLDALSRLADSYERRGEYEQALAHARRRVELEPWDEAAHQQVMRLLALTGQRTAALAQYEACHTLLADELGVEPESETTHLYQRIRDGELEILAPARPRLPTFRLPHFLLEGAAEAPPPLFVARERELARLAALADRAMQGTGCVAFVTGGPGQGKSALLGAFVRRAMAAHPDLLVARGDCNATSGAGDPYLPFRDVMAMLTGDLEARLAASAISRDHARRLWAALPCVMAALLRLGSSLIGTLLDGDALLSRLADAASGLDGWSDPLRTLAERARSGANDLEQSFLFEQCTRVLRDVAEQHPLALVLDDVQWADNASIGLLFHLGRRLARAGNRILILCAYRPEEVGPGRGGERHPLEKVLHEFKRTFGDVWVDLDLADQVEGRRFVDAFLDTEPNRLEETFRAALFHRTAGHPLFTIELLRAMQERGDLVRDEADGAWIQGPELDWQALPARVEAAIEARVDHLEPGLREIASVASVEGEQFTAQVVATVQGAAEKPLLRDLQKLETVHHLIRERGEVQMGSRRSASYRFGHVLIQEYLYQHLSQGERRLLHGQVAAALESFYGEQQGQAAVQLAHHFLKAGDDGPALRYSALAAESAARRYAHQEAITLYTQAITLAQSAAPDVATLAGLHCKRGLAHETLGSFEPARADYETALQAGQTAGERRVEWRALLDLGRLWASRDYNRALGCLQRALELAQRMDDPAALAESLNWMGNWHLNAENPQAAIAYHREALEIFEQIGDRRGLATTLDLLGIASLLGADITASVGYYDRAIALFRELDDRPNLASSLTGRGHAGGTPYTSLAVAPSTLPIDSRRDYEEALRITREIGSPAGEAWVLWSLALLHLAQGRYGQALEAGRSGLDIASQISHREWIVGCRCILGVLYVELFAPEEARRQLEPALTLAEELQSRHWIHHATGTLAATYCLLDDRMQAQTHLETVLSPKTPMDTLNKRYCWARRAELALCQGDPALALEIAERLIASAPGLPPGGVITFLCKLKGEALAAMGHPDEAESLLHAAVENARVTGEHFLLWRVHASLGWLYHTTDRQTQAEEAFSTARGLIQELADTLPDGELRDNFLQRAFGWLEAPPYGQHLAP